jgi:cytochrome bd ubiquinol oxidase subunit I
MDNALVSASSWQFAITAAFHVIFPSLTVGLALLLVFMYGAYMKTGKQMYLTTFRFWRKIFGVGYAIGLFSGVVLTFEFGLNWANYANAVGPIVSVFLCMELISAFFLEASFFGILMVGDGRVSKGAMFLSTIMVLLGTLLSVTWILDANSWMQTPAGYDMINGQFRATNWAAAMFNPSFGVRFAHMLLGVLISASFLVAGVAGYYLLKRRHLAFAKLTFSLGLGIISLLTPLQFYLGDGAAVVDVMYQGPKPLAMEGNFNPNTTAWNVFIIPDQAHQRNIVQVSIPCLGSAFYYKDLTCQAKTPSMTLVPPQAQPPLAPTFWGFHLMYYLGLLMLFVTAASILLRLRGRLYSARWFHRMMTIVMPIGAMAIICGWVVAEVGRQPWVVYGKLMTSNAVSPLSPAEVQLTLWAFIVIYIVLLTLYIRYLVRAIRIGPDDGTQQPLSQKTISNVTMPAIDGNSGIAPALGNS